MKAWINADNGSNDMKMALAKVLTSRGWEVHVGETGSNVHYQDYFAVTADFDVYITLYNGFCAGTVREAYGPEIQAELQRKGVRLVIAWDSREWLQKMRPYRYGNFRGYSARRAWDDNFSREDPSIPDVWGFLREHHAAYCVGPDAERMADQLAGAVFRLGLIVYVGVVYAHDVVGIVLHCGGLIPGLMDLIIDQIHAVGAPSSRVAGAESRLRHEQARNERKAQYSFDLHRQSSHILETYTHVCLFRSRICL